MAHLPQESHSYWISSICCLKEVMQSSLMILLHTTATLIVELAKTNLHTTPLGINKWSTAACLCTPSLHIQATSQS